MCVPHIVLISQKDAKKIVDFFSIYEKSKKNTEKGLK